MPESPTNDPVYSEQERRFVDAIDRILAGNPLEKTLKKKAGAGKAVALNVTNVALEAGYARTYLYKNKDAMARIWGRIEACSAPQSDRPESDAIIRALRDQNAQLRAERNLAIDAARRCMQDAIRAREDSSQIKARARLEREIVGLKARITQLEQENARLRPNGDKGNIVPFPI